MTRITDEHVEKLLAHWASEHWRAEALYHPGPLGPKDAGNPLADQVVHRTRERGAREVLTAKGRAAVARRLIAQSLSGGTGREVQLPDWAGGDPIRGKETRSAARTRWVMDPIAEQVERWVQGLYGWDPRAALSLRAHYLRELKTGAGARWVERAYGARVTKHNYLAGIARGRLHIRRSAEAELKKAS